MVHFDDKHETNTLQGKMKDITFNDQQLLYCEEAVSARTGSAGALHHHVGEFDERGVQTLVADTRSVVHHSFQQ